MNHTAGIVGIAKSGEEQQVREALNRITYRGGAGVAVRSHERCTLGMVWPTPQELFAGSRDGYAMVMDGEIYNWASLASSDASPPSAIVEAYRTTGPDFVVQLDGPFALAIEGPKRVFLARDPVGAAPLYYGRYEGRLCFASELKALVGWAEGISIFPPGHFYDPDQAGLYPFYAA